MFLYPIYIYIRFDDKIIKSIPIIHQHVHLWRESQSHAPAHVLMRLCPIDKSFVCLTKRQKDVVLEFEIKNSNKVIVPYNNWWKRNININYRLPIKVCIWMACGYLTQASTTYHGYPFIGERNRSTCTCRKP
jgi:hypothetical protein